MIQVRHAPGMQRIEDLLLLNYGGKGPLPLGVDIAVNQVSRQLFGIIEADVSIGDGEHLEDWEIWEFEQDFETYLMDDYDAADFLRKNYNLDFAGADGKPLRCTRHLKLQAEAAAKGYAGRMPDPLVLGLDQFRSTLEEEAKRFLARKR